MDRIDKRNGIIKVTVLIVLFGIIGAAADVFLNNILNFERPLQLLGWLLPAGTAVGIIAGELAEIRQVIRSAKKEKRSDN